MSSIPAIVLSSIAYGNSYPPYDGVSPNFGSALQKGNGYYGYTDGLHTVSYNLTNFIGKINFQATLSTSPTDNDWFDITSTIVGDSINPVSGTYYFNFSGNFVWCRCRVVNFSGGNINSVLYNT